MWARWALCWALWVVPWRAAPSPLPEFLQKYVVTHSQACLNPCPAFCGGVEVRHNTPTASTTGIKHHIFIVHRVRGHRRSNSTGVHVCIRHSACVEFPSAASFQFSPPPTLSSKPAANIQQAPLRPCSAADAAPLELIPQIWWSSPEDSWVWLFLGIPFGDSMPRV